MRKDLTIEIPKIRTPQGVDIQQWRMDSQTKQEMFLSAHEAAFGYRLMDLASLCHHTESKLWKDGVSMVAFYNQKIIRCVITLRSYAVG
jgi:hypothetical protein